MRSKILVRITFAFHPGDQVFLDIKTRMVTANGDGFAEVKWGVHTSKLESFFKAGSGNLLPGSKL
jgi:hypothetical protein